MNKVMSKLGGIVFLCTSLVLSGCVTTGGSQVSIEDKGSREHMTTGLTMADYTAFAEVVTNKMLSSRFVSSWGKKRPKLVVASLRNNSDDESIRMQDIYDRISETILNSGIARLMDISAEEFDYVVKTELSSTRQFGKDGAELVFFKLEFKMFTLDGEMVGQWSDLLPLKQSAKSMF